MNWLNKLGTQNLWNKKVDIVARCKFYLKKVDYANFFIKSQSDIDSNNLIDQKTKCDWKKQLKVIHLP